jgi:hypothetical protein
MILALVVIVLAFMLPFVLGFILFVALAVWIFMLLARMGLLPGFVFKTYRFPQGGETWKDADSRDDARANRKGGSFRPSSGESRSGAGSSGPHDLNGWYQDDQEGEIITLPETALKKDEDDEKSVE